MDTEACNYQQEATEDDGSCDYLDVCGICGGDINSIEECPECSDGQELGCDGICALDPINLDVCGICGGNNSTCTGCMDGDALNYDDQAIIPCNDCCEYESEFSCNNDVCLFMINEDTVQNKFDIYIVTNVVIKGIQLDISGASIVDAEPGDMIPSDWSISSGDHTILGFVIGTSMISPGEGILLSVSYQDQTGIICIENPIFSDENANSIDNIQTDCSSYFTLNLNSTGIYQLIIFESSISSLDTGDEIGVLDLTGITESNECGGSFIGEVLVGSGIWVGEQLEISNIGSADYCSFDGPQLNGWVEGNPVQVKIWDSSQSIEFDAQLTFSAGDGIFGEPLTAISGIELVP